MVSYFSEEWFPAVRGDVSPLSLFSTLNVLSVSFNVFSLFISRASRTFQKQLQDLFPCVRGHLAQVLCNHMQGNLEDAKRQPKLVPSTTEEGEKEMLPFQSCLY